LIEFGVFGRFYLALAKTVLGHAEEGAALAADAARVARIVRFPHAAGFAELAQFMCALLRGDVATCRDHAARAEVTCAAQGFPEFVAMSRFAKGWAAARVGDHSAGTALMRDGIKRWDQTGFATWQVVFAALLAEAELNAGMVTEAQRTMREADTRIESTGETQACAPLLVNAARLAVLRGETHEAMALARKALATSEAQGGAVWRQQVLAYFPALATA
jgi:predicted ATPase